MTDTDTSARCALTIGYDCGCTEIERLTVERDVYKVRAEVAEAALREIEEDCKLRADSSGRVPIGRTAWIMLTEALALIEKDKTDE